MRPIVAGLAILAACTSIPAPPTPESARIVITVPGGNVAQVRDRVAAAFLAEGAALAAAEPAAMRTVPMNMPGGEAVYRASVIEQAGGVSVTFTGAFRNTSGAMMASSMTGGSVEVPEFPLHSAMTDSDLSAAWQRLVRVASRLSVQ